MERYHDREWGRPVRRDRRLFEHIILDGAQAGLSWLTILRKREGYRRAYRRFDPETVARFGARDVRRLLADPGIVRNRLKVASSIENARLFLEVRREHGTFSKYLWGFVDGRPVVHRLRTVKQIPPRTPLSDRVSKDLNARGFKFVGSTIVYAFLQAAGLVNDHLLACPVRREILRDYRA